jgi:hypothetical protein
MKGNQGRKVEKAGVKGGQAEETSERDEWEKGSQNERGWNTYVF